MFNYLYKQIIKNLLFALAFVLMGSVVSAASSLPIMNLHYSDLCFTSNDILSDNSIADSQIDLLLLKDEFLKIEGTTGVTECVYKMCNSEGTFLGFWSVMVPDYVSCGSKKAKELAIADYNVFH